MSELEIVQKNPKIVQQQTIKLQSVTTGSDQDQQWQTISKLIISKLLEESGTPVYVEPDGKIHFKRSRMSEGRYYPFTHKGKEYLVKKDKNFIDIYEIKG
ncbi:MAG TPA: hypothetical protein VGQ13_04045 [Nitrososphaera sp.]|jgi:hypothetical protein|nr:hypothetical protein [Nitrososphaera sp.]